MSAVLAKVGAKGPAAAKKAELGAKAQLIEWHIDETNQHKLKLGRWRLRSLQLATDAIFWCVMQFCRKATMRAMVC